MEEAADMGSRKGGVSLRLAKINSLTLQDDNQHAKFELCRDPNELLGSIFWQLKRVRIEKYNDITVGPKSQQDKSSAESD